MCNRQGEVAVCLFGGAVDVRVIKDVKFTYLAAVAIVTYEVVDLKGANWQWLGSLAPQFSWVKTTPGDPLQLVNEFNRTQQQHKCTATIWRQAAAISTMTTVYHR